MKRLIQHITFGKPVKGEPLKYNKEVALWKTTIPFDIKPDAWEDSIKQHGYQDFINWLIKIHKNVR